MSQVKSLYRFHRDGYHRMIKSNEIKPLGGYIVLIFNGNNDFADDNDTKPEKHFQNVFR